MTVRDPPNLSDRRFKGLSKQSKQFIKSKYLSYILLIGILLKNPEERLTLKEILDHEWFVEQRKTELNTDNTEKQKGKSDFEIYSSMKFN